MRPITGGYLNPVGEEKEAWLEREGMEITRDDAQELFDTCVSNCIAVVACVQNPEFSAALVMGTEFDRSRVFDNPEDTRPVRFFVVSLEKLTSDVVRDPVLGA